MNDIVDKIAMMVHFLRGGQLTALAGSSGPSKSMRCDWDSDCPEGGGRFAETVVPSASCLAYRSIGPGYDVRVGSVSVRLEVESWTITVGSAEGLSPSPSCPSLSTFTCFSRSSKRPAVASFCAAMAVSWAEPRMWLCKVRFKTYRQTNSEIKLARGMQIKTVQKVIGYNTAT